MIFVSRGLICHNFHWWLHHSCKPLVNHHPTCDQKIVIHRNQILFYITFFYTKMAQVVYILPHWRKGAYMSLKWCVLWFTNDLAIKVAQRCQHSIFKMLNDVEIQSEKCLIYDEMVKNLPIFCLIIPIFFAYIKQKWKFQGLKWVMITQNE